jgi:hypothetical protein
MLIRNVKSFADLERKKNLQAQLLQVQVDNESMLESRVKDYQNPNKPPPLPPQYKTNAELSQDTNFQQKEVIDNLLSISGVDNIMALGVSQELSQLPNGVGNFLIFNKNFPVIKKRIEDVSKRNYNVSTLMNKIEEVLQQIEQGILYQSTGGSDVNLGFNMAMGGALVLPSGQTLASLRAELQANARPSSQYGVLLSELYRIQNEPQSPLATEPDFIAVLGVVEQLCEASPLTDYLQDFDLIEFLERQKIQKDISRITNQLGIPRYIDIDFITQNLNPVSYIQAVQQAQAGAGNIVLPPDFQRAYSKLLKTIQSIKQPIANSVAQLKKVSDKITALLGGQVAVRQQLQGQLTQAQQQVVQAQAQQALQAQQLIQARNRVVADTKIVMDNVLQNPQRVRERLLQQGVNPYTNVDYYPIQFKNQPFTFDGTNNLSPDNTVIERRNVVISEYMDGAKRKENMDIRELPFTFTQLPRQQAGKVSGGQARGSLPPVDITYELIKGDFTPLSPQEVALFQNQKDQYLTLYVLTGTQKQPQNQTKIIQERYTPQQLADIVSNQEINPLKQVLDNDPNYDPTANQADRKIIQHGFGLKKGKGYTIYDLGNDIKGFFGGAIPKGHHIMPDGRLMKDSEHYKGSGFGDLSSLIKPDIICPAVYDPVMKNGKWYSNSCEASAYGGMLKPPRMCPQNVAPVRAKDGKIYGNRCKALEGGGEDPNFKGSPYAIDGMGFMNRKIKIGKGIAVQEQPRYRTFGKYIIHIPYLENDNVLNVKFQSMGSIPSIKPVSIDDNFKEFIMDILNTSQVNQQHYNSLTEAEKAHFHKIVKGAGLSNALKFKADDKIDDKKDVKRLDILVGQIVAGNDNDKVMKEAKELIKKCVSNGSITRHRGMDLLFQIE